MRLTRIFTPGPLAPNRTVTLTAAGSNHLARVLRAKVGEAVGVFDGDGNEFRASITSIGKAVVVHIDTAVSNANESPLPITLVQGVSRGERMDWVVQKATELGVAGIVPVVTARSVVKLDREQAAKRLEHWRNIVVGACEQCGRSRLPHVASPQPLTQFLSSPAKQSLRIVLDPTAAQSFGELTPPNAVEILIGPEGGLDEEELAAAKRAGFAAVSIGPRILRTETAAVAAIAVMQGKWGDLR